MSKPRDELGNTIREKKPIGILRQGEVAISAVRLEQLEAKERAHDAYLRATQRIRKMYSGYPDVSLRAFSELVIEESRDGWSMLPEADLLIEEGDIDG